MNLPSSFVVHAGDTINAEVSFVPGGLSRSFLFQMTDTTPGGTQVETWSSVETMQYVTPPRSTAEWIIESPNSSEPLANYGQMAFTGAWATVGSTSGPINTLPNLLALDTGAGGARLSTVSNPPAIANSLGYGEPASGLQSSSFTMVFNSNNTANTANAAGQGSSNASKGASLEIGALDSDEDALQESGPDPLREATNSVAPAGTVRVLSPAAGLFTRPRALQGVRRASSWSTSWKALS